ncbi:MAG TPA: Holliday junction DNA helicase RuvA [Planctomycetaceae bacterium]|uniref:Holliday junction branch migration protein RuvA n=1 Tax=Rubinisphaera sp. TaxID=2024857 RepID=UPI000C100436|nr:Holliday junction branch migration protein RuvA [Rubinisphaera sp.]MBV08163.1 Holliday junction DNA helicase RuvA [Rubinisphaera sp.]HBN76711.1 Holliday junction DNA helicase RuvA [Planctomycetaceae bacterium]HCS50782.1 Holliday junction DNA helicase RuvA [Planctomycetaceae bacterium]
MIASIRGPLKSLEGTSAYIQAGPFLLEVYIPDFVRRQLQGKIGQEVELLTMAYLDGNPQKGGRMTPRVIGFMTEAERTFFELICSVDGLGIKKALAAIVRPVREVAYAIEQQDTKTLSTLPGIGPAVAERIVAKLRRKMTRFALMVDRTSDAADAPYRDMMSETFEALIALGHTHDDARNKIDSVESSGKKYKSVEDVLSAIYQQEYK